MIAKEYRTKKIHAGSLVGQVPLRKILVTERPNTAASPGQEVFCRINKNTTTERVTPTGNNLRVPALALEEMITLRRANLNQELSSDIDSIGTPLT
jgi:hypothetical protein